VRRTAQGWAEFVIIIDSLFLFSLFYSFSSDKLLLK